MGVVIRTFATTLAGFVVAAAILLGLASVVGVDSVVTALEGGRPPLVALVGVAIVAWICLWGAGLWIVLRAVGETIPLSDAVLVHAGAAFANNVTPFGQVGGEPVAAWLISDISESPYERSLAAMTSFDTINGIPSLCFALLGLAAYALGSVLGDRLRILAVGVSVLALTLTLLVGLGWRYRRGVERWLVRIVVPVVGALAGVLPRVGHVDATAVTARIERFVASIERIAVDRPRLALAVLFSAGGWGVQVAGLWVALAAVGATVPPYVPLFVVPLGTIASALPTPGGLGGIETVQVSLLTLATGVPAATITAAVGVFSVGGLLLTVSLGATAVGVLQVRERNLPIP
jgi:uncharacterized protein (TIRG00374 family)